MRQLRLIILLILSQTSLFGQADKNDLLLGTWEHVGTDGIVVTPYTVGKKPFKRELFLKFNADGKVEIEEEDLLYKVDYSINGSTLQLGDTKYSVEKITSSELVLKDKSLTDTYKKTEKVIATVKGTEEVTEKYPNGKIKIQGQKISGFKNGIWVEWYESGQIKHVTHYNSEIPYMDIEFDIDGKVKSKSYYDLKSRGYKKE